jgi:thiamine biosynthesis lipoprotein
MPQSFSTVISAMGTQMELLFAGSEPAYLKAVGDEIEEELSRLENRISRFISTSEVNRINQCAGSGPVLIDPEMVRLLKSALDFYRETDGAFDITVAPLLKKWGFYQKQFQRLDAPTIRELLSQVGSDQILLDTANRTVKFKTKGMEIDFGGMGKGYALEKVLEIIRESEIPTAFVSFGGSSVYALGQPPGRDRWQFSYRISKDVKFAPVAVTLKNEGFSISANYERQFKDASGVYGHIFDPHSGKPAAGLQAAAVIHESPLHAEILSTAFMVLGWEKSQLYLERHPEVKAMLTIPFLNAFQTTNFNFGEE